ncbi:tripartite motif-containing protein 43-like [Notamacropus eugenii]|uniref:tripartite motif-containing protein 43-like n=1 Tax=Notamacropus eugenii TaxID=9315 RepID=UPI003B67EB26
MLVAGIEEEAEGICAICWNVVSKTIIIDCGHHACWSCLRKKSFLPFCCPTCWEFSHLRTLQADIAMHSEGEGMCELHRQDQKLFCESGKMLLCVACSKSEPHEDHIHWPIAVAALGYRKMIQTHLGILVCQVKEIQKLLFHEKERSLTWTVGWTDHQDISRKNFEEKIQEIGEYLKNKEKTGTAEVEELIMGTGNEKFIKLYQKLKEMEAAQEHDIMEQKKKWEAMMSRKSSFLTDKITELEEKNQKSNIELLQDVSDTFERIFVKTNLKPFIPHMDPLYLNVATEFLKLFHASGLSQSCNFYNFSEENKSTLTFVPDSSGKTYAVHTTGNLQADSIRMVAFLLRTSPPERILEERECTKTITPFWTAVFEG